MGREEKLVLYGPVPAKRLLHQAVHLGVDQLGFPLEIVELKDGERIQRHGYSVRAVGVHHRINALGYVLEEDVRAGRFNLEKARALGVPEGPDFGRAPAGRVGDAARREDRDAGRRDGRRAGGPRSWSSPGTPGPASRWCEAATQADLLIHESTFSDDEQARALETRHSTAREADASPSEAGAHRLILTHLSSSRYDTDFGRLLAQAREEFQGPVEVAHDGLTVDVPVRE